MLVRRSKRSVERSHKLPALAWHEPFNVQKRRLSSVRCTVMKQAVATRNASTTRGFSTLTERSRANPPPHDARLEPLEFLGNGYAPKRIEGTVLRYKKGPIRGIYPPPASGRTQRASTLAKTTSALNPPASPRSGTLGSHRGHHSFPSKYKRLFVLLCGGVSARFTPHPVA